jgi:hypothetical protein
MSMIEKVARAIDVAGTAWLNEQSGRVEWYDVPGEVLARAAIEAMREPGVNEWQPIETAPKDRRVLVFVPGERSNWTGVFTAWAYTYGWITGQEYEPGDDETADGTVSLKLDPTHWMPLPRDPPKPWMPWPGPESN